MRGLTYTVQLLLLFLVVSCTEETNSEFTGREMTIPMISGTVQGNTTNGILTIRERTDGYAQIEIIIENVIQNAKHPVHLHFGSLEDNGNVATMLNELEETNSIGKSVTILDELENGEVISYSDLIVWNGSIKIHFEASGPFEDQLIASTNIGINQEQNRAYIQGDKDITICNSQY